MRGAARFHPHHKKLAARSAKFWGKDKKQPKHKAQFTFGAMGDTEMTTAAGVDKRQKTGNANMIPDLGPLQFGFPNNILTKLKYSTVMTLSSTSGSIAKQTYAANGLFDPDITGAGHQPAFFDTWKSVYGAYQVIGSKITVNFINTGTAQIFSVGIIGDDDGTTSTTFDTLCEANNQVNQLIGYANGGKPHAQLFMTYSPMEHLGVEVGTDGFSNTLISANPTDIYYFTVFGACVDGNTATVLCRVDIEYTVKFDELLSQVQN